MIRFGSTRPAPVTDLCVAKRNETMEMGMGLEMGMGMGLEVEMEMGLETEMGLEMEM